VRRPGTASRNHKTTYPRYRDPWAGRERVPVFGLEEFETRELGQREMLREVRNERLAHELRRSRRTRGAGNVSLRGVLLLLVWPVSARLPVKESRFLERISKP